MTGAERIAAVARRVFRMQRAQRQQSYGNTTATFANALMPEIARMLLSGMKRGKGKGSELAETAASVARERSQAAAREINATTAQWLDEGRDPREVFGPDRAVTVGLTEAVWAESQGLLLATKARKGKLRWVTEGKPCKICLSMAGQVRKAGQKFKDRDGGLHDHPPSHPSCRCRLESVT